MKIPSPFLLRYCLLITAVVSSLSLMGCSKEAPAKTAADIQAFQGNPQETLKAQARADAQRAKQIQESQARSQAGSQAAK